MPAKEASSILNIRVKQLKRRVGAFYSELKDPNLSNFAATTLFRVFGEDWNKENSRTPPVYKIAENLSDISLLGQIYSRVLSQLAADDPTPQLFYKLECLFSLGGLLLSTLAEEDNAFPPDISKKITLSGEKFEIAQEQLRPIKKKKNNSIINIEGIVVFVIANAEEYMDEIRKITSWNQLLSLIFGIDVEDQTKGARQIEQIHIKEQILAAGLEGSLIERIFIQYDGLLAYTMSMLTMLSSTEYSEAYIPKLNSVLEKLGSSTQMVLFQGRLNKTLKIRDTLHTNFHSIKKSMMTFAQNNEIDYELDQLDALFTGIVQTIRHDVDGTFDLKLEEITGYSSLKEIYAFKPFIKRFKETFQKYVEYYDELHNSLKGIDDFFSTMIRSVNSITADLFSRGFQASLPTHDVETCEAAGIHLKNITATSSTMKVQISDKDFDVKQKLVGHFEDLWNRLKDILIKKQKEEAPIDFEPKIFGPILEEIQGHYTEWTRQNVWSGYQEEAIIVSRILFSTLSTIQKLNAVVQPYAKTPLNVEILENMGGSRIVFDEVFAQIGKISATVLLINSISKNLWHLSREFVLQFGKDPKYIQHPDLIMEMIQEIPEILKRELFQRLLPRDQFDKKRLIYQDLKNQIGALASVPKESRDLILPYEDVLCNTLNLSCFD